MNIIKKSSIGLDISDDTMEIVKLVKKAGSINTVNKGRLMLESGIVSNGQIKDKEKLKKTIEELLKKSGINSLRGSEVNFAMPESQVFIKIINIDIIKNIDERDQVESEVYKNIPIRADEIIFNFKEIILEEMNKVVKKSFLIIATSKKIIKEWQDFFLLFEVKVRNFDVETLANHRNLFNSSKKQSFCILDIGKRTTNISIFKNEEIIHTYSLSIAGNYFTNLIQKKLKIDYQKAEKLKKSQGMKDKAVKKVLLKAIDDIAKELKSTFNYYKEIINLEIGEIILIGGSSKLKGLKEYFESKFQGPVNIGKSSYLKDQLCLEYTEAVGLALKSLDKKYQKNDLSIFLPEEKSSFVKNIMNKKKENKEAVVDNVNLNDGRFDSQGDNKKIKKQFILLIAIVLLGVILIGFSYIYRKNEKERKVAEIESSINEFLQTQLIDLSIVVAISPDEYIQGRVKARVVEDELENIKNNLVASEFLWDNPLSELLDDDGSTTTKWMIYNKNDVDNLFLEELKKINNKDIKYNLVNIEAIKLRKTENKNLLYLDGIITISVNELIEI